ncbi:MAG: hypothetical protein WCR51_04365 [Planctomycetia bacterium]
MSTKGARAATPNPNGELQRRMDAILASGVLNTLPKGCSIVLMQARQWAGFKDCRLRLSLRKTAQATRKGLGGVYRAVAGLVAVGVLREVEKAPGRFTVYEICAPKRRPQYPTINRGRSEKPWAVSEGAAAREDE